jgi:protein-S-isoprenylcysteine O-methyltransferase Ste14
VWISLSSSLPNRSANGQTMNTLVPPPVVALIVGAAMYGVARVLALGKFELVWQTPLAMVLLVSGGLLLLVGAVSFVVAKTTINPMRPEGASHLITTGIYRLSRNPIYLADVLLLAAWAVWLGSALNIVFLVVFVAYIQRFQILPEERALRQIFGENYTDYCSRVRRWL